MSAATAREVRAAGYRRLEEARAEAGVLVATRDPERVRAALVRIARLAKRTLDEADGIAGPSLVSHVRMQMAAAFLDLAVLEPDLGRRARLVDAGRRACDLGLRTALASRAPLLARKVVPWGMVVLTGGLRAASDGQRASLQRLLASCAKALPAIDAWVRHDAREAAGGLLRAQLLEVASRTVADAAERDAVRKRAAEVAREARRRSIGAGDFVVAEQAARTLARLER